MSQGTDIANSAALEDKDFPASSVPEKLNRQCRNNEKNQVQ
jgi:hypothetical protein